MTVAILLGMVVGMVKRGRSKTVFTARGLNALVVGGATGAGGVSSVSRACGFGIASGQIIGTSAINPTSEA
jgi:hypothetical protein